jgi:hypothetical protein
MAKGKKRRKSVPGERVERARLTREESLKRMEEFAQRKEQFVATAGRREGGLKPGQQPVSK